MIGWLRAAWDDSRRAAYTRRGSNPMSREEWFDLHDVIGKLDSKISQLPDLDTQRKLFDLYRKKDVYTSDVYTNDLDEYLDAVGVAAPFTDAQEARIRELVLDETNRAWKDAWQSTLGAAGLVGQLPGLASGGGVRGAARSELDDERSARSDEEDDVAQIPGDGVFQGLSGADDVSGGIDDVLRSINRYLERLTTDMDDRTGVVGHRHFDARTAHGGSSPSVGDAGAHSVGEGEVAGVETAAPVTDATGSPVDVGCSAQVMLAGHVIDVTLTQNEYAGAVTMSINLPDGLPVWRRMTLGELRLR